MVVTLAASFGCGTWVEPWSESTPPLHEPNESIEEHAIVNDRFCTNIHAVLIAKAERLGNCAQATISTPPISNLGAGCAGMTADECAQEHYDHPTTYVNPAGSGSFELTYLPNTNNLKCADGTKPHYYFSPGTDATKWVIYQNGSSGKCGRAKDRLGNYFEAGETCFDHFDAGDGNSGFGQKLRWEGKGILDGGTRDASGNLVNVDFHSWNRVWIPSCSNDQYQGSADHPTELVLDGGSRDWHAPLFSHGFDIVTSVIDELASGAVSMDLSSAELVMLYGSSGGAGGLLMTLDAKAEYVAAVSSARVVGLLDSRAEPNLAGAEGLFDGSGCGSIFAADCPARFDTPPSGTDVGAGYDFDSSAYQAADPISCPGCGVARIKTEWWGNMLDESCVAAHPINGAACYDGYHVLYNHTATPVFHATSLRDRNQYNNPIDHATVAAGEVSFQTLEASVSCGDLPRERVIAQLQAYWTYRDGAGGARGDSKGAGPIGIWAIDWADHEITKKSELFNIAALNGITLSAAIRDWAVNENPVYLIEAAGHATRTTEPPSTFVEQTIPCIQ
ncbi:MAG: pectin acetylesterase-family hydrolase [Kofleriaceae bacterium]